MEDLFVKIGNLLIDKLGINGLLIVVFGALWIWERRERVQVQNVRLEDLKTIIPAINSSTAAHQSTTAAIANLTTAIVGRHP